MATYRTLPNGKATKSKRAYVDGWQAFNNVLEATYHLSIRGFDPGVLVTDKQTGGTGDLPMWLARRLYRMAVLNRDNGFSEKLRVAVLQEAMDNTFGKAKDDVSHLEKELKSIKKLNKRLGVK